MDSCILKTAKCLARADLLSYRGLYNVSSLLGYTESSLTAHANYYFLWCFQRTKRLGFAVELVLNQLAPDNF